MGNDDFYVTYLRVLKNIEGESVDLSLLEGVWMRDDGGEGEKL